MHTFKTDGLCHALAATLLAAAISSATFALPANEDLANAFKITDTNATVSGTVSGATSENREPKHGTPTANIDEIEVFQRTLDRQALIQLSRAAKCR
ncbi:hypothetical protein AAFF88_01730 [Hyphobacterium sp. WM6]